MVSGQHQATVGGHVDADNRPLDLRRLGPPCDLDHWRATIRRVHLRVGHSTRPAPQEQGVVRVQKGVHPIETGQEPGGQVGGMEDRFVALQSVKARHASLPVLHRAGPRAR